MRISRFIRDEQAAALVEFAITIPILLLLVWTVIDFARAYYTSNSLSAAVREGARVAAVQSNPSSGTSQTVIRTRVKDSFKAFGGAALTDGYIFIYDSSTTVGNVTVKVQNYPWLTATPITFISGGQILMTRAAKFRYEREASP